MSRETKLSSRYQITVSKAVRHRLSWIAGLELAIIPKGKGLLIMPVPSLKQLVGIAKSADRRHVRDRQDRF